MVWLVSHLKATWPPNANLTQPPQWCVPGPPRRKSATPGPPSRRWTVPDGLAQAHDDLFVIAGVGQILERTARLRDEFVPGAKFVPLPPGIVEELIE